MKKKIMVLCLAGLLAICALVAGCGSSSSGSDDKVLRVGTNADFPPFEYQDDTKGSEYQGFDMDLIRAIGKQMGYKVEIQNLNFDGLIPALQAGNIDTIIAGMSITPERKGAVLFSNPYYTSGLTILVNKDNKNINSFKDLKGKRIAVQLGTSAMDEAQKVPNADVKALNSSADTFVELKAGHVDAIINDRPVNDNYLATTKDANMRRVNEVLTSEQYAIAMKQGNTELADKINAALKEIKANGEYAKIYKKWFGTEPSADDLK